MYPTGDLLARLRRNLRGMARPSLALSPLARHAGCEELLRRVLTKREDQLGAKHLQTLLALRKLAPLSANGGAVAAFRQPLHRFPCREPNGVQTFPPNVNEPYPWSEYLAHPPLLPFKAWFPAGGV